MRVDSQTKGTTNDARFVQRRSHRRVETRRKPSVCVKKQENGAAGRPCACVQLPGPAWQRTKDLAVRVLRNSQSAVAASAIDNNRLDVLRAVQAIQGVRQVVGLVESRNDYRDC